LIPPPDREPSLARSSYAGGGTVESPNAPVAVARAASRGRLAVRFFPALLSLGGTFQMHSFLEIFSKNILQFREMMLEHWRLINFSQSFFE